MPPTSSAFTPAPLDLKIINGTIIDGSGSPRRRADVGVRGERIAVIGDLSGHPAKQTMDASDRMVAPGFIDVHGHDDLMFIEQPDLRWKISQGVTTVIVGNCGVSAAPAPLSGNTAPVMSILGREPLFSDTRAYLDAIERLQPVINVATLVGHGNLRLAVMNDPLQQQPTQAEQEAMQALLADALQAGAAGFSTGLAYAPGKQAGHTELAGLARVAASHGRVHTSHIRDEADGVEAAVQEVLSVARATGCATVFSHHKCMMPRNWGRSAQTLAHIDRARDQGMAVALDIYPYPGSSTVLIPERADAIEDIRITWSTPHPECSGRALADIAREWGCGKTEAARRLVPAGAIYFAMDEQEVRRIFQHPCCMVGSDGLPSDARPHPRLWGSFTRVLGRFVREAHLVSLETAIAKMTALPARVFGLQDRGVLRAGAMADIVVFNPDTVLDLATWDAPTQASIGIDAVLVNGVRVFPSCDAARRPGTVLRRFSAARPAS